MSVDSSLAVDQSSQAPSFRLKGGLFPLTLLELASSDLQRLRDDLTLKVAEAPAFFQQAPAVLSLEVYEDSAPVPDLRAIQQLCLEFGLIVVALRGANEALQATAKELNLAILANSRSKPSSSIATEKVTDENEPQTVSVPAETAEPVMDDLFEAGNAPILDDAIDDVPVNSPNPTQTKVITTPVRSGQQIYAAGGDLIVLAPVSAGAELLADGNIHVYGALRGRALAGVKGNTEARVFCQSLEAELISIAGYFKLNEDLRESHWKQSIQASLTDETLNIEPLKARGR
ncbi:septum site-determining protein MinC [Pseudomaricurvus sp.]|uniref:septum site-determining protein MinC n=1 Tax=Pseudomaricurvus sp. TaxID=2004510 RepID=UPI003F6CF508